MPGGPESDNLRDLPEENADQSQETGERLLADALPPAYEQPDKSRAATKNTDGTAFAGASAKAGASQEKVALTASAKDAAGPLKPDAQGKEWLKESVKGTDYTLPVGQAKPTAVTDESGERTARQKEPAWDKLGVQTKEPGFDKAKSFVTEESRPADGSRQMTANAVDRQEDRQSRTASGEGSRLDKPAQRLDGSTREQQYGRNVQEMTGEPPRRQSQEAREGPNNTLESSKKAANDSAYGITNASKEAIADRAGYEKGNLTAYKELARDNQDWPKKGIDYGDRGTVKPEPAMDAVNYAKAKELDKLSYDTKAKPTITPNSAEAFARKLDERIGTGSAKPEPPAEIVSTARPSGSQPPAAEPKIPGEGGPPQATARDALNAGAAGSARDAGNAASTAGTRDAGGMPAAAKIRDLQHAAEPPHGTEGTAAGLPKPGTSADAPGNKEAPPRYTESPHPTAGRDLAVAPGSARSSNTQELSSTGLKAGEELRHTQARVDAARDQGRQIKPDGTPAPALKAPDELPRKGERNAERQDTPSQAASQSESRPGKEAQGEPHHAARSGAEAAGDHRLKSGASEPGAQPAAHNLDTRSAGPGSAKEEKEKELEHRWPVGAAPAPTEKDSGPATPIAPYRTAGGGLERSSAGSDLHSINTILSGILSGTDARTRTAGSKAQDASAPASPDTATGRTPGQAPAAGRGHAPDSRTGPNAGAGGAEVRTASDTSPATRADAKGVKPAPGADTPGAKAGEGPQGKPVDTGRTTKGETAGGKPTEQPGRTGERSPSTREPGSPQPGRIPADAQIQGRSPRSPETVGPASTVKVAGDGGAFPTGRTATAGDGAGKTAPPAGASQKSPGADAAGKAELTPRGPDSQLGGGKRELTGAEIALAAVIAAAGAARVRPEGKVSMPNQPNEGSKDASQTPGDGKQLSTPPGLLPEFHIAGEAIPLGSRAGDDKDTDTEGKDAGAEAAQESAGAQPRYRALQRPTYLIGQGETLVAVAETLFHDPNLGWLIADLNSGRFKESRVGAKRVVEIASRQEIYLPVWQDIVDFYESRSAEATPENLITVVVESQLDLELIQTTLAQVVGTSGGTRTHPQTQPTQASSTAAPRVELSRTTGLIDPSVPNLSSVLRAGRQLKTFLARLPAAKNLTDFSSKWPGPPAAPATSSSFPNPRRRKHPL